MDDLPFRNWCLSCLRISITKYDPQTDTPFQVTCTASEDWKKPSCSECYDRNLTCEPPSMGMLGDIYDFCEILEWTGEFWSRQEPLYWMWSFRLAVGEAIEELCLAFEYAEMCHRRYYMFGIDWDHKSEEHDADMDHYRRFLVERRAALPALSPPTTGINDRQDWLRYNPERLLRLRRGDFGFLKWSEAKTKFIDRIQQEFVSMYGAEVSDFKQRMAFIDKFPANLR